MRAMAHAGHGRGVSRPRWARASCQGTSRRQRSPNHASSWTGSPLRSVHSRAWGAHGACGSRTRTQRIDRGGMPACDQTAVAAAVSTTRSPARYQPRPVPVVQSGAGCRRTGASVGSRSPVRRGRPCGRGWRGGAGAERAAAPRTRVMPPRGGAHRRSRHRPVMTAQRRSGTSTRGRVCPQRRTPRSRCRGPAGSFWCRWPRSRG